MEWLRKALSRVHLGAQHTEREELPPVYIDGEVIVPTQFNLKRPTYIAFPQDSDAGFHTHRIGHIMLVSATEISGLDQYNSHWQLRPRLAVFPPFKENADFGVEMLARNGVEEASWSCPIPIANALDKAEKRRLKRSYYSPLRPYFFRIDERDDDLSKTRAYLLKEGWITPESDKAIGEIIDTFQADVAENRVNKAALTLKVQAALSGEKEITESPKR